MNTRVLRPTISPFSSIEGPPELPDPMRRSASISARSVSRRSLPVKVATRPVVTVRAGSSPWLANSLLAVARPG